MPGCMSHRSSVLLSANQMHLWDVSQMQLCSCTSGVVQNECLPVYLVVVVIYVIVVNLDIVGEILLVMNWPSPLYPSCHYFHLPYPFVVLWRCLRVNDKRCYSSAHQFLISSNFAIVGSWRLKIRSTSEFILWTGPFSRLWARFIVKKTFCI